MAEEQELRLDLEELKHLGSIAKRPRVQSIFSSEIRKLEAQIEKAAAAAAAAAAPIALPPTIAPAAAATLSAMSYVPLDKFSWDQDIDKIKIYVFLEGVEEDKVDANFKSMSMDIKFHGVQGKNYRCAIPKLNKEIVPEKCKVFVKPSKVILTLFKSSKGNWLDLYLKEEKLKPSMDRDKDPMAGIMDLMKNMYEEGDDEMKRTIAKAWTDSRSGKAPDPLKGYRP